MSAVIGANVETPPSPPPDGMTQAAANFEAARAGFVREILAYIEAGNPVTDEVDPAQSAHRRDEILAQCLFYTQSLYEQLAQTMALLQGGGIGGIL